jgi:hypothetical protein
MKTKSTFFAAVLAAFLLTSCLPRERMAWSPDGKAAIVATRDGLVVADAAGGMLGPITTDGGLSTQLDGTFVWEHDGSALYLVTEKKGLTWKDAAKLVPADEAARVEILAKSLPLAIRAGKEGLPAGENKLEDVMRGFALGEQPLMLVAMRAAYESDPDTMKALFAGLDDEKEVTEALGGEQLAIVVYQIRHQPMVAGKPDGEASLLLTSLFPPGQLAPSPDGKRLAFTRKSGDTFSIEHISAHRAPNHTPVVVYPNLGAHAFVWSADGSRLFVARLLDEELPLGRIESVSAVPGADAKDPRVLAEGMMANPPSLALLPDGSILFPSSPVTYPITGTSHRPAPAFHRVSPDGATITKVPTADGALSADLRFFAVSPDGRHVAIVESGSTTVATLELNSGEVKLVANPSAGWKCLTRPAWRNNAEFTYAAEKDGQPVVMLHSLESGSKPWGKGFPDGAFSDWLEPPEQK